MLDELVVRTAKIQRILEEQQPKGVFEPFKFTITKRFIIQAGLPSPSFPLRGPWISVNLTNDGPNVVTYGVNDSVQSDEILVTETREINMKKALIQRIELTVTGSATLRFVGIR